MGRGPGLLFSFESGDLQGAVLEQGHSVCSPLSLSDSCRVISGSSTLRLCHLAAGTADACQFGLHCWDLAAATVIIREAGAL